MEKEGIENICQECIKTTRIRYDYHLYFFGRRLESMSDLHHGKVGLVRHPLARIAEWLYQKYDEFRHVMLDIYILMWIFKKNDMNGVKDSYFTGRVVYASPDTPRTPIVHLRLEVWARTWFFRWVQIAAGYSDEEGKFHLPYTLRAVRNWKTRSNIRFEIHHIAHIYIKDTIPTPVFLRYHTIKVPKSDLIGMGYDMREIPLDLWRYRTDTDIPRAWITDPDGDDTESYSPGRLDALFKQVIPIELIKEKHLLQIRDFPDSISLEKIQKEYPENLTRCIERKAPGYTRSDEWFGRRMMNGMNCGSFLPDRDNQNHFWIKYFGICGYDHNNEFALPDVDIKFEISDKTDYPMPIEIHTTGALNIHNQDKWQKRVFTPADGPLWEAAKRIARVNGAVSTEVDEHFTGTHINTEQYSIAAFRNFHLSPLTCLLFPHLKEASLINASADKTIIEGYLPTATALTAKGLKDRTRDLLGVHDWKDWTPMEAMSKNHNYAIAENMFWDVVNEFVEKFFAENLQAIKDQWLEVYLFSKDLVEHSVPVFLSDIDWSTLSPEERKQAEARKEYYAYMFDFNFDTPRERVNGKLRAISLITANKKYDETKPEEMDNLKKACAYAIMTATFLHTWINEQQYDDLGEIMYSSGGLRFGTSEAGVLGPESDLSIAPDMTRGTQMLWFTNLLSRTEYGFITRNEEGDVNPIFQTLLQDKRDAFLELGVEVNDIESRTNI
jgi:hypothetical protein